ncbi:hypothetical protein B0H10DRAFT_2251482, partial [Mycena sp. CBHHK59/15]
LLTDTGRYRELLSWCKNFKRVWWKLEKTPITLLVNLAYKTDAKKMICTCPLLPTSRFLLCKHTVQGVACVPPVFFLEVRCQPTAPFWVHPALRPLDEADTSEGTPDSEDPLHAQAALDTTPASDDEDDNFIDTQGSEEKHQTFLGSMDEDIDTILEFAKGLQYQRQLRDQHMLTLEREGVSFLRLARACLGKEKCLRST